MCRAITTTLGTPYPKANLSRFLKNAPNYDTVPYEVAAQMANRLPGASAAIMDGWCADCLPPPVWAELSALRMAVAILERAVPTKSGGSGGPSPTSPHPPVSVRRRPEGPDGGAGGMAAG